MLKARRPGLWLPLTFAGILLLLLTAFAACTGPSPTPTSTPTAAPTPTPIPVLSVGMQPGQRYHDIHVNRLALQCNRCHTASAPAYQDPLAQVFNLADRRACVGCHKEGSTQPFYGEDWQKASVK